MPGPVQDQTKPTTPPEAVRDVLDENSDFGDDFALVLPSAVSRRLATGYTTVKDVVGSNNEAFVLMRKPK